MDKKGTPPHKKLVRAEKSKAEWKAKALERREEAERLKSAEKRKTARIEELLEQKEQLSRELSERNKTIDSLQEELKKKAPLDLGERPRGHRFHSGVICMALKLYSAAVMGCRKVASALKVMLSRFEISAPHHTTVRQWVHRYGCYQLDQPVEKADDWLVIADATLDVGTVKCLAVIGVRMEELRNREDMVLSHNDVTLLGLYPTESLTGEHFETALSEIEKKVGTIDALVIDEGGDMKKGARLYQEKRPTMKVLHDIKHKMALVMKRHLEDDAMWSSYVADLAQTRSLVYQTELAVLKPPCQRSKARYMDIGEFIEWPARIREAKNNGCLDSIPDERYQKYIGWIENYVEPLQTWSFMVATVKMICHEVRTYGLSKGLHENLTEFFLGSPLEERLELFVGECLEKVIEEVAKLEPDETLVCSTEVLESIFGKHKQVNTGKQGMTGSVLGMGAFIGSEYSDETVKEAMECASVKTAVDWIKQKVGDTMGSLRRRLMPPKGTKFDKINQELSST